ncbi:hypothetical protein Sjap_024482 [Stephania japonica]|uniref:Uncharacterized protein n=1 Tax=Stephania japonica TaxID=461633 RepID=A0AAP0HQ63_9MAGN
MKRRSEFSAREQKGGARERKVLGERPKKKGCEIGERMLLRKPQRNPPLRNLRQVVGRSSCSRVVEDIGSIGTVKQLFALLLLLAFFVATLLWLLFHTNQEGKLKIIGGVQPSIMFLSFEQAESCISLTTLCSGESPKVSSPESPYCHSRAEYLSSSS